MSVISRHKKPRSNVSRDSPPLSLAVVASSFTFTSIHLNFRHNTSSYEWSSEKRLSKHNLHSSYSLISYDDRYKQIFAPSDEYAKNLFRLIALSSFLIFLRLFPPTTTKQTVSAAAATGRHVLRNVASGSFVKEGSIVASIYFVIGSTPACRILLDDCLDTHYAWCAFDDEAAKGRTRLVPLQRRTKCSSNNNNLPTTTFTQHCNSHSCTMVFQYNNYPRNASAPTTGGPWSNATNTTTYQGVAIQSFGGLNARRLVWY